MDKNLPKKKFENFLKKKLKTNNPKMTDSIVLKISPLIRFLDKLSIGVFTYNFGCMVRFCIKVKVDSTLIPYLYSYCIIYIRGQRFDGFLHGFLYGGIPIFCRVKYLLMVTVVVE